MAFQQYPQKGGIPSGNTAGRPSSPVIGDTYYNGQLEILEIWNGTAWVAVSAPPATPSIATPTDASTTDAYTSTAGKLQVVFTPGSGGGTPNQYNAYTTAGGFSGFNATSTVVISGLTPGTAYTVYGNAQNNFGTTVNTANAAAVTPTTLPEVRTIGTATNSGATTDVVVTWTNGNNGGKNLTSITITPFLNGTTAQTSQTAATTSSTSHTFTGLTEGSSYTFKVKATNANGTCADSTATNSVTLPIFFNIDYLVVAGGGGGGGAGSSAGSGGGGGAGGYRSFTSLNVASGVNYAVTVGAGGAGGPAGGGSNSNGTKGSDSIFNTSTSTGGGYGGAGRLTSGVGAGQNGGSGGSGGGGGYSDSGYGTTSGGAGNTPSTSPSQGNNGGNGSNGAPYAGAGGGGASAVGGNVSGAPGAGGAGTANSITGTSVTYAGGGGGGAEGSFGAGGAGGGGNGGQNVNGTAGTVNLGGGGGGAGGSSGTTGGSGGSGVVIIKYPDTRTITIGAGLTGTESSASGGFKRATITAGTGNVSWA